MSDSTQYSSTPSSLDPERLLKKHELQKTLKCRALAESQGGELQPLATGAPGSVTESAKKLLQVICSKQDVSDSNYRCYTYDFWVAKTSLTLQKTTASEAVVRSSRASGRQCTALHANNIFPDSIDTHFKVSG